MDRDLDVRGLEPPEPLERVLDALADLPADDRLRVRVRREPFPLYDLLRRMGYAWSGTPTADSFEVLIWPRDQGFGRSRAG